MKDQDKKNQQPDPTKTDAAPDVDSKKDDGEHKPGTSNLIALWDPTEITPVVVDGVTYNIKTLLNADRMKLSVNVYLVKRDAEGYAPLLDLIANCIESIDDHEELVEQYGIAGILNRMKSVKVQSDLIEAVTNICFLDGDTEKN